MLSFYVHLYWFYLISTLFFLFLLGVLHRRLISPLYVSVNLFSLSDRPFPLSFYIDFMSSSFISTVLLISSVIMIYSHNYMAPYSKRKYFLWLTFLFVVRMLLLVRMSRLFYIILGWDGLGLVSFFLIVYYQNPSSLTSGLFTLFINRLGDGFFLLSLCFTLLYSQSRIRWIFPSNPEELLIPLFLCTTFMTKRAIFPFSPWLPLAIAAPTPISALVHSSTLVTSGLYLMMRYSHLLLRVPALPAFLITIRIFTSFYAGLASLVELDLKKLIALSTLSHLGFISLSLFSGLITLSFFHLLAHAMFKSLLFMSIGDTIIRLSHSQDIRYLSSGTLVVPSSASHIVVSSLSLLGMPRTTGFFSKDLILESINFSTGSSLLILLLYINVIFTFFYTFQLVHFCTQPLKSSPYCNLHSVSSAHSYVVRLMSFISLVSGSIFLSHFLYSVPCPCLPLELKALPLLLLSFFFLKYLLLGSQYTSLKVYTHRYFSSILNLLYVTLRIPSYYYLTSVGAVSKTLERGLANSLLNSSSFSLVLYSSRREILSKRISPTFLIIPCLLLFLLIFLV